MGSSEEQEGESSKALSQKGTPARCGRSVSLTSLIICCYVRVTMSQWPTGMKSVPQFLNLSIVLQNMGLPQVARDHAARCRQTQILTEAATLFDQQALRSIVAARYSRTDAREAHKALERSSIAGRVVLEMHA